MTASTHLAFSALGYFVATTLANAPPRMELLAAAGFASLLPDVDVPTSGIGRTIMPVSQRLNRLLGHRTFTHSLLGILSFAALAFPLYYPVGYRGAYGALLLGYASHVLLDQQNVMGVELLWPARIRAVLFLNERYRMVVGGNGEYMLLCVLVVVTVSLYPMAAVGLKRSLHYVLGDVQSAVSDFRELEENWDVEAVVTGAVDAISGQKPSGVFPVIGAPSNLALLVEDRGRSRLLAEGAEAHMRPHRVWVRPTRRHVITVQRVAMGGRTLGDVRSLVEGRRAYLFGELALAPHLPETPASTLGRDQFATVRRHERRLTLAYATWAELVQARALDLPIAAGDLIVKYVDVSARPIVEPVRIAGEVVTLSFTARSLDAILVRVGDRVEKGALLAYRAEDTDVGSLVADLAVRREQALIQAKGRWFALQDADGDLAKARHDLARVRGEAERYGANSEFFPRQARVAREKLVAEERRAEELELKRERLRREGDVAARQAEKEIRHLEERLAKKRNELEVRAQVAGEVLSLQHAIEDRHVRVHLTLRTFTQEVTMESWQWETDNPQ